MVRLNILKINRKRSTINYKVIMNQKSIKILSAMLSNAIHLVDIFI